MPRAPSSSSSSNISLTSSYPVNGPSSKVWRFIYRGAEYPDLPYAFQPYVRFCAWIASPQTRHTYLLRGFIQFDSYRHLSTLQRRYSKKAEWFRVPIRHKDVYDEYVNDPVPHNAKRYVFGVPLNAGPSPVRSSLPVSGFGVEVPDLFEDYSVVLFDMYYPREPVPAETDESPELLAALLDYSHSSYCD